MRRRTPTSRRFVLASASPRRRQLMKEGGYRFKIVPSRAKETYPSRLPHRGVVQLLAKKKALDVAARFPDKVVIGADTIVSIGGKIIGKPRNRRHAKWILKRLSGRWQRVYTGVAVAWKGGRRVETGYAVSHVKLKVLSDGEIDRASKRHLDKAGAYAVQERRDPFVTRIRGDYDNVVGLPMKVVNRLLALAG